MKIFGLNKYLIILLRKKKKERKKKKSLQGYKWIHYSSVAWHTATMQSSDHPSTLQVSIYPIAMRPKQITYIDSSIFLAPLREKTAFMTFCKENLKHRGTNTTGIKPAWAFKTPLKQRRKQQHVLAGCQHRQSCPGRRQPSLVGHWALDSGIILSAQKPLLSSGHLTPTCTWFSPQADLLPAHTTRATAPHILDSHLPAPQISVPS